MAVIYLQHPVHGSKVAISEQEANYDEMNGWMRYDLDTPASAAVEDAVEEPVNEMAAPKRRGRPRANLEG